MWKQETELTAVLSPEASSGGPEPKIDPSVELPAPTAEEELASQIETATQAVAGVPASRLSRRKRTS